MKHTALQVEIDTGITINHVYITEVSDHQGGLCTRIMEVLFGDKEAILKANLIVRAVNSHADLVQAVREARHEAEKTGTDAEYRYYDDALAKATKED